LHDHKNKRGDPVEIAPEDYKTARLELTVDAETEGQALANILAQTIREEGVGFRTLG
jgi:hypothetical protein